MAAVDAAGTSPDVGRRHHRSRAPVHAGSAGRLRERQHRHQVAGAHADHLGDRCRRGARPRSAARSARPGSTAFQSASDGFDWKRATTWPAAPACRWPTVPAPRVAGRRPRVLSGAGWGRRSRSQGWSTVHGAAYLGGSDRHSARPGRRSPSNHETPARSRLWARAARPVAPPASTSTEPCRRPQRALLGRRGPRALHPHVDGCRGAYAQDRHRRSKALRRGRFHRHVISAGYCGPMRRWICLCGRCAAFALCFSAGAGAALAHGPGGEAVQWSGQVLCGSIQVPLYRKAPSLGGPLTVGFRVYQHTDHSDPRSSRWWPTRAGRASARPVRPRPICT